MEARLSAISRIEHTIETTVIMREAVVASTSWAVDGSCPNSDNLAVAAAMRGSRRSMRGRAMPSSESAVMMSPGRSRKPTRRSCRICRNQKRS